MKQTVIISIMLIVSLIFSFTAGGLNLSVSDVEKLFSDGQNDETVTVDAAVAVDAELMTYAKAVVLMEKSTGKVLYAENENEQLYPASVTKIMTILLVCEAIEAGKLKLEDTVSCSDNASSKGGSQIWLEPGESMTVHELLKATCIYSANDACTLLGELVAGSEAAFNEMMNARAAELGMSNTHFDNCTGLDDTTETHLTTAYDVALMSRELLKHDFIKEYTTVWMDTLRNGETQLVNTNKLVRFYDGITGLKTGTTEKAGCCVSASAERNGMELIAVVMGSENSNDRFTSAENLLDWGFANYELYTPAIEPETVKSVEVRFGESDRIDVVVPEMPGILINKGASSNITVAVKTDESTDAPVAKGQCLGQVVVSHGDKIIAEFELTAEKSVPELTFFTALFRLLTSLSG